MNFILRTIIAIQLNNLSGCWRAWKISSELTR